MVCTPDDTFIAIAYGSNNIAAKSDDGKTWQAVQLPVTDDWNWLTTSPDGRIVILPRQGEQALWSDGGMNWNITNLNTGFANPYWVGLHCTAAGEFLAIAAEDGNGGNYGMYSSDLIDWKVTRLPLSWKDVRLASSPSGATVALPANL